MKWWKLFKTFPVRIFLVALILRLIPVVTMRNMGIGLDDMFQYDMIARSIVSGNGYRWYAQDDLAQILPYIHLDLTSVSYDTRGVPTSFRPPLYPTFLALIYLVAGAGMKRFLIARLVQTALAASLAPLTYTLARQFFPDRSRTAVIAAWVITLYPLLLIYPLSLATENLFFVLMLTATLVLLKAADSVNARGNPQDTRIGAFIASHQGLWDVFYESRWFILAGILLGLMALTRSVSLGLAGVIVLWIWFVLRERKMALVVFSIVTLITLPWMIRNTFLNHRLTGVESSLGYDLYLGYYPAGSGTFQYPQSLDLLTMLNDSQRDSIGLKKALEFIQADPGRFSPLVVRRTGYFFSLERRALTYFYSNNFFGHIPTSILILIAAIVCLPFVFVCTSGFFGLAIRSWRKQILLLAVIIVGYTAPHLFILAEDRFHLALVPFFAILAAFFWTSGRPALKIRWQTLSGKIAICLAVVVVILLLANWSLELWRDTDKLARLLGPTGNQTYFSY